jgi:uncharacterized RDD family membrane protein YckC
VPESARTAKEMPLLSFLARLTVLAAVASTFVWGFWFQHGTVGSIVEVEDGASSVSAGTAPVAIVASLLALGLYFLLLKSKLQVQEFNAAPMWSRAAAFIIDFWFALFMLSGLLGFVPILLEAARTGVFRWHFERNYTVPTDAATIPLVLVMLGAFVAYFLLPMMMRGQTVGCWIFRLATVNTDGYVVYLPFSMAIRRLYAEFGGVCSPFKTFRQRDEQGRTFYDRESGFTVVRY